MFKKTGAQARKEREAKIVKKIIEKLLALEKKYPSGLVERACGRYKTAKLEKRNAEEKIKSLTQELEEAKSKLR